ncbi:neuronal acetylcholine receptor subunit beta-3-like [Glandiceps talaboti]
MNTIVLVWSSYCYLLIVSKGVKSRVDTENRLHRHLFGNYNKNIRPADYNETAVIDFGLAITQILDVDEKHQILKASGYVEQTWQDSRLQWNPSDYHGLNKTVVPTEWIWCSDMVLLNSAVGQYEFAMTARVLIFSNGLITYFPPAVFETPCIMNILYFPFDVQRCPLEFGPWAYTIDQSTAHPVRNGVNEVMFLPSTEWNLINSSAMYLEFGSSDLQSTWAMIRYTLVLKRRPLFYIVNVIIPCIMMALLTMLVFLLPSDSGEKMSFGVSILITMSVFNLLVADIMPPSAQGVPLIARFLFFNTCLVAMSIAVSVFVLRLHHRPAYARSMGSVTYKLFFKCLPKMLCIKLYADTFPRNKLVDDKFTMDDQQNCNGTGTVNVYVNDVFENLEKSGKDVPRVGDQATVITKEFLILMKRMASDFQFVRRRVELDITAKRMTEEWKYVAMVMDRLFLCISMIIYVSGTVIMFTNPGIYQD